MQADHMNDRDGCATLTSVRLNGTDRAVRGSWGAVCTRAMGDAMAGASSNGKNGHGAFDVRHMSKNILDGVERAGARAMLKGIGLTDEDLQKPMVLIANTWIETMPCNYGLRTLAHAVKEGVKAAGGTPLELNTVAISDGITMGTEGMKTSLVSREVIADS